MRKSATLLMVVAFSCFQIRAQSFVGTSDFSSTANWSTNFYSESAGALSLGAGNVVYTAPYSTSNSTAVWLWTPGNAPFTNNWSVTLQVWNDVAVPNSFANIGVTARLSSDPGTYGFGSRLDRAPDGNGGTNTAINWEAGLDSPTSALYKSLSTATNGLALLTFDSVRQLLTAGYSEDGGTTWQSIASINPVTEWGMTFTDTFLVAISASSYNMEVTNGVSADNFSATDSYTPTVPEPSSCALVLFGGAASLLALKRRKS